MSVFAHNCKTLIKDVLSSIAGHRTRWNAYYQ